MLPKRKLDTSDTDSDSRPSPLKTPTHHANPSTYACEQCHKEFKNKNSCDRHILSHFMSFVCDNCEKQFTRKDTLQTHRRLCHHRGISSEKVDMTCLVCKQVFKDRTELLRHQQDIKSELCCDQCHAMFIRKSYLTRHVLSHSMRVKCNLCGKEFRRREYLHRHKRLHHPRGTSSHTDEWSCARCQQIFSNYEQLYHHVVTHHPLGQRGGHVKDARAKTLPYREPPTESPDEDADPQKAPLDVDDDDAMPTPARESALGNTVQDHTLRPSASDQYDMLTFFARVKRQVEDILQSRLRGHGIKWYLSTQLELYRENDEGQVIATAQPHFRGRTYATLNADTLSDHDVNEGFQKMAQSLESYLRDSSGWIVKKVIHLKVHTVVYSPLGGSSYIMLPKTLRSSGDILNIRNRDQKCFTWCILASLHPVDTQPEDVSHYEHREREVNMTGIPYPVSISHLNKVESQNSSLSINVFACDGKDIIPLKITSNHDRSHHVNLLLLKNEKTSHYCLIRDLDGFLSRTKSCDHRTFFCWYCLTGFIRADLLRDHVPYCSIHGAQKIKLPDPEDNILKFKEFERQLRVPFVIYADFETLNKKIHSCAPDPSCSSTTRDTLLEPCSFGYKIVCIDPKYTTPTVIYRGPDAAQKLIECLLKEKAEIEDILADIAPMRLTPEDRRDFSEATTCCICDQPLGDTALKVRHHCHVTSRYIGCAHSVCNLECKQAEFVPVIFHGLRNFDAHILCQAIGTFKNEKIKCIPQNLERYVSFSLGSLRFIDSFQFLPSSLATLVNDLADKRDDDNKEPDLEAFPYFLAEFPFTDDATLLLRKGVYPYEFMDDESKFDMTHLPPIDSFYSSLTKETISREDYEHAQTVFHEFCHENMGDYHDLYLQTDVLLLCDVFESYRDMSLKQYKLDPCHFYTSPGLSWSAMLKMTQVHLELMTDIDQINFVESAVRGGVSQISNRYKRANNPYLEDFDPTLPTSYLTYIDSNNLYGWSMSQPLPHSNFTFLSTDEISAFDVSSVTADSSTGFILEVSLKYPHHLHDVHNDFPLAPESKHVDDEQLSAYAVRVLRKLHGKNDDKLPPRANIKKLLTTLEDKDHYVLHYRILQLYLDLGLELKGVHRVLKFHQEAWMEPYIRFNTEMRKMATSTFQKNLYKLMNNSCFGKTMENVRKHRNVELCHQQKRVKKLSAKPTYLTHRIFSEDLVGVELSRAKVTLNKPVYCGMTVLDYSKYLMYNFYYNHLKVVYGQNLQLQLTDTDSFLFSVETDDIFDDVKENLEFYDTSDFPPNHELHSNLNKKVMGKFKFETGEKCISEFVGLRSKMYSFRCGEKVEKKAKGIKKATVARDLTLGTYKQALFSESQIMSSMTHIRSDAHLLHAETIHKVGLSCFDDKRYLMEDGISSLAYGHYSIAK